MTSGNEMHQASLEYTLKYNPPIDPVVAERNLKEAKQILSQLGIVFLLGSGTCLGAIRDNAFIPWDDDVDLFSVIGVNGSTENSADTVADAFRAKGYFVDGLEGTHSKIQITIKDNLRLSMEFLRIVDDHVYSYPGIRLPSTMFTNPKEINFLGEKFLVPNPPDEYLLLKYGEGWMMPKKAGEYEKDVIGKIPEANLVGQPCRLRVLDNDGKPVHNAEVVLVAGGHSRTNEHGYAEMILPGPDWYALVIKYPGHEQVLYMEQMEPDKTYVYRSDAMSNATKSASGETGTLGNILISE